MLKLSLTLLLACLLNLAFWFQQSRPVAVEPSWDKPLASASFAPYRDGQSPLTQDYPPPEQIAADLAALKGLVQGVRTYTSREGMEAVPRLAREYGMSVTHSAWLGVLKDINEAEVAALIKAAHQYPDTIKRVIVGNEVLLRRDLPVDQLIAYIDRVRAAVEQPVSYADVWAFWLKYPQVAEHVDFITVHILPYWEDEPAAIDDIDAHFAAILQRMREAFPGKPILVGEAGWPSQGRSRGPADATLVNAARFVRTLPHLAEKYGFDYNVVEAFDQSWKSKLEGTVGARWGMIDAERRMKFPLTGPVPPLPDWPLRAALSLLAGLLPALLAWRRLAGWPASRLLAYALYGQFLGVLWTQGVVTAVELSFHTPALLWASLRVLGLSLLLAVLLGAGWGTLNGSMPRLVSRLGPALLGLYTLAAVVANALLAFDGRYRDVPLMDFLLPALGVCGLILLRRSGVGDWRRAAAFTVLFRGADAIPGGGGRTALWTIVLLLVSVLAALGGEGFSIVGEDFTTVHPTFTEQLPLILAATVSNREVLLWAAMLLLMTLPFAAERLRPKLVREPA
ncbi:MAG TPA: exo-beta-1,3-glucanase [Candidatus Competibacteraceae bacterium]|nr:exo-beta-1,3-glucanase [Candidatus Competibacteraceae bacterium]